jgi:hypothetical protein
MEISPYVEALRRDLLAAAEAGGPEVREAAQRLDFALDPAVRLTLMEAVSQAASEITAEMAAGSVDVRLDGRDLAFVVDAPAAPPPPASPPPPPHPDADEDGDVVRITLRLPEGVKTRAEELASRSGHSLNTWLVNAVRAATGGSGDGAVHVDLDLTSLPFGGGPGPRRGRRMTGWI